MTTTDPKLPVTPEMLKGFTDAELKSHLLGIQNDIQIFEIQREPLKPEQRAELWKLKQYRAMIHKALTERDIKAGRVNKVLGFPE